MVYNGHRRTKAPAMLRKIPDMSKTAVRKNDKGKNGDING